MTSLSVRDTPCGRPSRHGTPPDIEANCTRAYVRAVMRKGKNPGTIRSPNTVSRVNQGKACDAVIRRIETREGHQRRDLAFPEREHHPAPIEVTCKIGERVYAFEHTRIEPFERQIELYGSAEISGRECVFYLEPRFACGHLLKSRQIRSPGDRAE
jgi:hypothetical protein